MTVVTCQNCGAKNRVDETKSAALQPKCGKCGTPLPVSATANAPFNGKPVELTDAQFDTTIRNAGNKPVLIDCWAAWCGPCRMIAPIVDQLAAESNGRYVIAKLDVDANPGVSQRYQISAIPTMLLFKNGQLIDRIVGLQPKQALEDRLARAAS
jgi:thioredoxin